MIIAGARGLSGWAPSTGDDGALSWLVELDLSNNSLSGPLPELVLPRLEWLFLDGNKFNSMPPQFFANMSMVQVIVISNSPWLRDWSLPNLSSFTALWKFHAQSAGISGQLLGVLGEGMVLSDLDLANNDLTGSVPDSFACKAMAYLDLSNNSLNGPISFIEKLPNVQVAQLDNNKFSGTLPNFDEYSLPQVFSVAHNRLTGLVPASLPKKLSSGSVYLSGNLLQGPVPVFAVKVQTDVIEAARTGSFCRLDIGPCDAEVEALLSIAMALDFPVPLAESWRRNDPCAGWIGVHCAGDKDNGGRGRVIGINLSRMFLNGSIHPAFANLRSLETIMLSGNNISGNIPPVLTQLPALRVLDVSDNVLEGSVPKFGRGVEVWAEGNPGLNVSSISPPIMSEQPHFTVFFVAVAVLLLLV
ncbi:hypothetical protein HU200_014675 [Digitaria exilis]|uniref:Leucine-rich repeat-containing N-terminal plant-type domain-containing protein n=1 Tax=Digitaria exilis TaxID=1010633 RepID=A0A835FBT6_9POAL|nr:hypothetical protein HU200_014675 [Digitaria exilis]